MEEAEQLPDRSLRNNWRLKTKIGMNSVKLCFRFLGAFAKLSSGQSNHFIVLYSPMSY